MTEQATVTTVEHGDASELPTPRWVWRRWYVFFLTAAALALVWRITERLEDVTTLRMVARYLCLTIGGLVFVYVAGATATDCVNMVSALKSTRKETVTTAPPPAMISTPEATVSTPPEPEKVVVEAVPPWERSK